MHMRARAPALQPSLISVATVCMYAQPAPPAIANLRSTAPPSRALAPFPPFPPPRQAVGRISVPELVRVRSPLEEEFGTGQQPVHTCTLHALGGSSSGSGLLLVQCPRELPAEQAPVWARTVMAALQPRALVVAATLPAMSYRGPGDPADEDLVFSLQTEAAAAGAAGAAGLPPPLPEGTMLGGLAAALLARAELQQLPAALVAGVQAQQVPDAQFLFALGQALAAALHGTAAEAAEAALVQQARGAALAVLGAAADAVFRSSASSSIFS